MLSCEEFYNILCVCEASVDPSDRETCHFLLYHLQAEHYSSPEPRLLFRFLGDPPLGDPFGDLSGKKQLYFNNAGSIF